jgi:glycosyltransferase involved in cell wall biosynthesis
MFYKPKVSVLMVVYNGQLFIKDAINSIVGQEYKNWELVIVNDASTDNTLSIIKKYKNKKIIIRNLYKNIGPYKATILGLNFCKGKYISFLDSDDLMHEKKILEQVKFLENNNQIVIVSNWYEKINYKNKIIKKIKNFTDNEKFNSLFPVQNLICNSSVMFRRVLLKEINFYNKNIIYAYDYNFYLKIFKKYKFGFLKKFYTKYRVHKLQRTQNIDLKRAIIKENIYFLNWSRNNSLINKSNILFYYRNLIINYLKLFFIN